MPTTLPIPYTTLLEGFSKGSGLNGPVYNVIYKIDNWDDSDLMINALVGGAAVTGPPGAGGTVTRFAPHQYPLSPNLQCVNADVIQGLGRPVLNANGYPGFDGGCLIQAEYRALPWGGNGVGYPAGQIDPTTPLSYCSQKLSLETETFTFPYNTFKYRSGVPNGLPTDVHVKVSIPITNLTLTFHQVPYMPVTVIRACRGKVNSTPFLGAGAGLVLFRRASTDREFNTDGSVLQEVSMEFTERDPKNPWNSLPARFSFNWYPVSADDGTTMYDLIDLNQLLTSW